MTKVSVADKHGQDVTQGGNFKEGKGAGEKIAKRNVGVDDEAKEPVEKIVTEDLFNKSDFAHYGSIVIDSNKHDNNDATK